MGITGRHWDTARHTRGPMVAIELEMFQSSHLHAVTALQRGNIQVLVLLINLDEQISKDVYSLADTSLLQSGEKIF